MRKDSNHKIMLKLAVNSQKLNIKINEIYKIDVIIKPMLLIWEAEESEDLIENIVGVFCLWSLSHTNTL